MTLKLFKVYSKKYPFNGTLSPKSKRKAISKIIFLSRKSAAEPMVQFAKLR